MGFFFIWLLKGRGIDRSMCIHFDEYFIEMMIPQLVIVIYEAILVAIEVVLQVGAFKRSMP